MKVLIRLGASVAGLLLVATGLLTAAPAQAAEPGVASLRAWMHSDARVTASTYVDDLETDDQVEGICYVQGDVVNGWVYWSMVWNPNKLVVGFVNDSHLYPSERATRACASSGWKTFTYASLVWQHEGPYLNAQWVGDVGGTSNLRGYFSELGEDYRGSKTWWAVFDPSVHSGRVGFVHCTDITLYCD